MKRCFLSLFLFSSALIVSGQETIDAAKIAEDYFAKIRSDEKRKSEDAEKALSFNGKTMRYEVATIGEAGPNGFPLYIALHGGGGAPPKLNDSQWEHMKVYYKESVKNGVYVAPRGVTDTWNLHFVNESYVLYDRLIENMIAFDNVDPNRVYVLGFSAGGDGVYQIGTRMADRFAAANMSAGHHNGVSPRNLFNLPFLVQVGQKDAAYKRNQEGVKFGQKLKAFSEQEKGGYPHEVNIHVGRGHNFLDNHPKEPDQVVITDPVVWLEGGKATVMKKNTNAITWLSGHQRKPLPDRVIWDLKTGAKREGVRPRRHYWLGLADEAPLEGEAQVQFVKAENQFVVAQPVDGLMIMVSSKMVDLAQPVKVKIGANETVLNLKPSADTLAKTIAERGDPNFMFESIISVRAEGDDWVVEESKP